jgi:hypothetical protein
MKVEQGQDIVKEALKLKDGIKHSGVVLQYVQLNELIKLNENMEKLIELLTPKPVKKTTDK